MMETSPPLEIIKPDCKLPLNENECKLFIEALSETPAALRKVKISNCNAFIIDGVLTVNECSTLCSLIDVSASLSFWCNRPVDSAAKFRNASTIEMKNEEFARIIWNRVSSLLQKLETNIFNDPLSSDYERDLVGVWRPTALNHDTLFARYPSTGSFAPHTDGRAIIDFNSRSFFSVILFLNDIPNCGGSTKFYSDEATSCLVLAQDAWTAPESLVIASVEAVAGRMLVFHQSLVHEGVSVPAPHLKYIIRSDVIFSRDPPLCTSDSDKEAYALYRQAEFLAEEGKVDESVALFRKATKMCSAQLAELLGQ